ncbi:MAG: glycoside hydrolase family 2 protein [Oscillospiraceae bacterium]|nr:glycoside hydrolase family 2 protein [Oscillospiraceae bacterium]
MYQNLNKDWTMRTLGKMECEVKVNIPCTMYKALLDRRLISDPFAGLNELTATGLSESDCVFEKVFELEEEGMEHYLLSFKGIDTLADIYLNEKLIGHAENMHREYVFDVTDTVQSGENVLTVYIHSPVKYITEKNAEERLWGVDSTMAGYPHIRKAHYQFGWDWGPKLPDMGIWRGVDLIGVEGGIIDGVRIRQDHSDYDESSAVMLEIMTAVRYPVDAKLDITVLDPEGRECAHERVAAQEKTYIDIPLFAPALWYPAGYGKQPLYRVSARLMQGDRCLDEKKVRIGIRTLRLCRDKDDKGEMFAFEVNGIKIFAMGADYIPQDQLITRETAYTTRRLLRMCRRANFNMLRVWGGGVYPADSFFDLCDEMGILVWQDFMFACSVYKADAAFLDNVRHEVTDNVKRIRNHPCLALWCGNNEVESMWEGWGIDSPDRYKKDYLRIFESLIPKLLEVLDPRTPYWPSSPSSGGGFNDSSSPEKGDQHFWAVWHSYKPAEDYLNHEFRFCSEYGFESLPSKKTLETFASKEDMNLMSPVMELHQKCTEGTEKLMYYMAKTVRYPCDIDGVVYATQLIQSDMIRMNVEHMRRSRGVCMGSLYWQVNDSNPVISWSSLDYFHRPKALHYAARRFYAPVLVSAYRKGDSIALNVSSEKLEQVCGRLRYALRNSRGEILAQGETEVTAEPLSARDVITLPDEYSNGAKSPECYLEYSLIADDMTVLSEGTYMDMPPKAFRFADPGLWLSAAEEADRFVITVTATAFARGVWLEYSGDDPVFSDNFFDLHAGSKTVYLSKHQLKRGTTLKSVIKHLSARSYYEMLYRV